MPAPIWGDARIKVYADGDGLVTQIRIIAKEAGEAAGTQMGDGVSKGFDKQMKQTGLQRMRSSFKGFFKDLNKELQENGRNWRDLSHNTRQWTLIIGAVAAAIPDMAGLVTAAGVGVLALGSAAASSAVGIGVLISTFKRFTGDLEDVPADVLASRKAFDKLKDTLSDLNGELTSHAFKDTAGAWESIGDTIRGLQGPLNLVADAMNRLIKDFADNLKPGTKNFENLSKLIENSAPIFESLVRSAGIFGSALLTAFTNPAMVSAVQGLAGWIGDIAKGFDDFVNGPAYATWVGQGVSVFEHLGGLIEAIGDALSGLFDQQSIDNLNHFIDGLADFLKGPGKSLIDFLDQLDIPGVVVDVLNNLGNALKPILDFATQFMKANPKEVSGAITAMATAFLLFKGGSIIAGVATNLVGFKKSADGIKPSAINKLAGAISGLSLAFVGLSDANSENGGAGLSAIGGALTGASFAGPIGALVGTVAGLVGSMIQDVFLTPDVKGAWQNGWDQIFDPNNFSGEGIGQFKKWLQDVVTGWGGMLTDFRDIHLTNFWAGVGESFSNGWTQIATFFDTYFVQPLTNGWNQIVTFFTVNVPSFFGTVGAAFANGWNQITTFFNTYFVNPITNAWNAFWNWLTVSVPNFFKGIWAQFQSWLGQLALPFTQFFATVSTNWNNFWNGLGGIVGNVWNGIVSAVRGAVNTVVNLINGMISAINKGLDAIKNISGGLINLHIPSLPGFASGGVLNGPRRILAGEAGPEAIVPLRRPLGSVDPSVRWLSAIAQGKGGAFANGGVVGGDGRSLVVSEGAIVVNDHSGDVRRTGNEVITRLVERLAG